MMILKKIREWGKEINFFIRNIFNKNKETEERGYEDLTPISYADEDNEYSNAILWGLNNEKIKNIAITGPYGSGKSSILKTFESNNKKFKFLNISLGSFKSENNESKLNKDEVDKQIISIEKSILQQILYRVEENKIPFSRFKRIKNIRFHTYLIKSFAITIWLLLAYLLIKNPSSELINPINEYLHHEKIFSPIIVLAFSLGAWFIINSFLGLMNQNKLNKLNIKSGELEFKEENGSSILNKHLDEILYFFEMTDFNIVVIEDLDRFEEIDIFIKLREINTLINNSDSISRKVVFIYAVRDDIFKEEDRTKFFDFIIPIIPIINSSNSSNIFSKKLISNSYSIDKKFINDITLYIEDMRMLKNIYNEFVIYHRKLRAVGGINYNINKLLGFIVYKNKYPADFAALNSDSGMVASFFKSKQIVIKKIEQELRNQLDDLNQTMDEISNEKLTSVEDLRKVYIATIYSRISNCGAISFRPNQTVDVSQLLEDEIFHELIKTKNICYYPILTNTRYQSNISFEDIEKLVSDKKYIDRELNISKKVNQDIEKIKAQAEKLKDEIYTIHSSSVKTLIQKFTQIDFFNDRIKECKLLTYLIRNGYIDEMYHTFTSYFYEGDLTKEDMDFILSVKNQEPKPFNLTLQMTSNIIDYLNIEDFRSRSILNFDLLATLLNSPTFSSYLVEFIDQLQRDSEYSLGFIDEFFSWNLDKRIPFIKILCERWPDFWKIILKSNLSKEKIDIYLKCILLSLDSKIIRIQNYNHELSDYVEEKPDFISLITTLEELNKIKLITTDINFMFKNLDSPIEKNDYFEFIYANNHYEKNINMIKSICRYFLGNTFDMQNFITCHITTIINSNLPNLIEYIKDDFDDYIIYITKTLEFNTNESELTLINIFNNDDVKPSTKLAFFKPQNSKISNIEEINDHDLWDDIFSNSKIKASWGNLISYFDSRESLNEIIISYLNIKDNYEALSSQSAPKSDSTSTQNILDLYLSLIRSVDLSDESYHQLIKAIPYSYKEIESLESLTENKIKILLDNKKLELSESNLSIIQESFPKLFPLLIEDNIDEFIQLLPRYYLIADSLKYTLLASKISLHNKLLLINSVTSETFSEANKGSRCAIAHLFDGSETLKINLESLKILISQATETNQKINILMAQVNFLDKSKVISLLQNFGSPIADIFSGKHPKIEALDNNFTFCDRLVSLGVISSFSEKNSFLKLNPKKNLRVN